MTKYPREQIEVGRSILILGVRELDPWLQQDQVADESLQFKGEGRGPGPVKALRTIPLVAFLHQLHTIIQIFSMRSPSPPKKPTPPAGDQVLSRACGGASESKTH